MELDTINRLYLELSQFATAITSREASLEKHNDSLMRDNIRLRAVLQSALLLVKAWESTDGAHAVDLIKQIEDALRGA